MPSLKYLLFAILVPFCCLLSAEVEENPWLSLDNFSYRSSTSLIYKKRQYDGKKDARALTTRNDISWQSPNLFGLSFFAEWHSMEKFIDKYQDRPYKDAKNHGKYTIIPDSDGNRFQELYGQYDFSLGSVKVGWQRIDEGKFIRHFDWRQNSESYRSVSLDFNLPFKNKLFFAQADKLQDRWMNTTEYDALRVLTLTNHSFQNYQLKFRYIGIRDGHEGKSKQNRGSKDTYSLELINSRIDLLYAYQDSDQKPGLNYLESRFKFPKIDNWSPGLEFKLRQENDGYIFDLMNSPPPSHFGWTESYGFFTDYKYKKWTLKAAHRFLKSPYSDATFAGNETLLKTEYQINQKLKTALILFYMDAHGNKESQYRTRGDELIIRFIVEFEL